MQTFKQRLAARQRLTCHVCTINSPVVPQALAASGADSVIVDMEHGAIGHDTAHAMIAALSGTACAPLVRVPIIDEAVVKRVLDLGAEGIVFPLVRSVADAERAVASMHYPPKGRRGYGPFIAQSHYQTDLAGYPRLAEDRLVTCLLVETGDAIDAIEDICAVPGIDLLIPAVFDLSTDLGVMGQIDHPKVQDALARCEKAAQAAGIPMGNVALSKEQADGLFARGYTVLAGFDALWMRQKAAEAQNWCNDG